MSRVRDGDDCEVWVMDDYGVDESFVKRHAFSQFDVSAINIYPYGFTLHNEFLFHVYIDHFILYDPIASKPKNFENSCPLNDSLITSLNFHFEDASYQWDGGWSKGNTSDLFLQFLLYLLCMILCFLISFLCQLSIFNALHLHPLLLAGYVLTFGHVGSFSNLVGCSLWFVSITLSKKH